MNALSERAKQLIPKARIVSFDGWTTVGEEAIARLQSADDEKQYLSDQDLTAISEEIVFADSAFSATSLNPSAVVKQLRDQAPDIVNEARAEVLQSFPGILEPGGGLYPPLRADACWRDFWHFLRCITYGIAGQRQHYTSPEGLAAMKQLYAELSVPLPAMVTGVKGIKKASLSRFPDEDYAAIAPYFDHLITQLSSFW
ncbi:MAG: phycobilisome protein [Phormidesmis sp.]